MAAGGEANITVKKQKSTTTKVGVFFEVETINLNKNENH
jgi:hypothetical protein